MDLKNLSGNWKKLQKQLLKQKPEKTEQPTPKTSHPPIPNRKRANEGAFERLNGVKRYKQDRQSTAPPKPFGIGALSSRVAAVSDESRIEASRKPMNSTTLPLFGSLNASTTSLRRPTTHEEGTPNTGLSEGVQIGKYVALDCEMVGVGPVPDDDSQLARVSIVNFHGHQIYDSFVKPQLPITDYRTPVSGITSELLKDARPFFQVQKDVADILEGRILVGHALKNDLAVLMLGHAGRDIRDTSRYPLFRKLSGGRSPRLKMLAKEVLGIDIQESQHCSVEDARTAMLLFRREKEGFEVEHIRQHGRPKVVLQQTVDGDSGKLTDRLANRTRKPKKKKKKKGKR